MTTSTDTEQAPAPTAADTSEEKADLIAQCAVLSARKKAVEAALEDRRARLRLLMKQDGDVAQKTTEGSATFIPKRSAFVIHDRPSFGALFDKATLVEAFKVDAAFYDAAVEAGIDIASAVTVEEDEQFRVQPRQTAEAKERQRRIIDETRREMEGRIVRLATLMRQANRSNP